MRALAFAVLTARAAALPTSHQGAALQASSTSSLSKENSKTADGCVPLTNNDGNVYTAVMKIGTPSQETVVVADTGSYDFVFPDTTCADQACAQHTRFNRINSSTFSHFATAGSTTSDDGQELCYGQGCIEVDPSYDVVQFGGSNSTPINASVGLIVNEKLDGYYDAPYDGIMGLGKTDATSFQTPAFLKDLNVHKFSICLGKVGGIGGRLELNQQIAVDNGTTYVPIESIGQNAWATPMGTVGVKGSATRRTKLDENSNTTGSMTMNKGMAAIIDSGTTFMIFPTDVYDFLYDSINKGCAMSDCLTTLLAQDTCSGAVFDALPDMMLTVGGQQLAISPSVYMGEMLVDREITSTDKTGGLSTGYKTEVVCLPLISGDDETTDLGPLAILGMPFLRQYSTLFDRDSDKMSVAKITWGNEMCETCPGAHQNGLIRRTHTPMRFSKLRRPNFEEWKKRGGSSKIRL